MNKKVIAAIAALAITFAGGAYSATIITITSSGTIDFGEDLTNVFGQNDYNINGKSYKYQTVFVLDRGIYTKGSTWDQLVGGSGFGTVPIGIGALTINDVTFYFHGYYGGQASAQDLGAGLSGSYYAGLTDYVDENGIFQEDYAQHWAVSQSGHEPTSILHPLHGNFCVQDSFCNGNFIILTRINGYVTQYASGDFVPTIFTATIADVPESNTWSMILVGLLWLGAILRWRRSTTICTVFP